MADFIKMAEERMSKTDKIKNKAPLTRLPSYTDQNIPVSHYLKWVSNTQQSDLQDMQLLLILQLGWTFSGSQQAFHYSTKKTDESVSQIKNVHGN